VHVKLLMNYLLQVTVV